MGLFGKKDVCSICGQPAGITKWKLNDGVVCGKCNAKCTHGLSHPLKRTVPEIRENIDFASKNEQAFADFTPTDNVGDLLAIDRNSQRFYAKDMFVDGKKTPVVFYFYQLKDYSITEDGKTIQKSGAGTAIAGGLLFGGVGAIAGGLAGRKTKEKISKMTITLHIESKWVDKIEIPIVTSEIKKGGLTYNLSKQIFENCTRLLEDILSENNGRPIPASGADEILKYKELLDAGIISGEEFNAKKKQILGL